ncbi:membrane protein [Gordonia jinhuaensis]|uniref:Integral membrane protein n=2 Tax=Gordonia jinhuaensis TaxID=1517702 RepID=A0A916THA9_9ACTN|nr:putative integral membrane protein [Gordonia jinhuaensis]
MMAVGVVAAIIAALAYGTASVLQARGAHEVTEESAGASAAPTLRSTIAAMLTASFLVGISLDVLGFAGNLVADRLTPLFLAQTIVSANLVVTAVLATFVLDARLNRREWTAVVVVVVALVVMGLGAGHEGHRDHDWLHWALLVGGIVLLLLAMALIHMLPTGVAVVAGLSGGILFGLMAVAIRILRGIEPFDLVALLTDPAAYAVVICGIGGFYLFTVALQTGAVSAASAAIVVGETVVPGALGIALLGDTTRPGWGAVTVIAFVAAVAGAVTIAMSSAVRASEGVSEGT